MRVAGLWVWGLFKIFFKLILVKLENEICRERHESVTVVLPRLHTPLLSRGDRPLPGGGHTRRPPWGGGISPTGSSRPPAGLGSRLGPRRFRVPLRRQDMPARVCGDCRETDPPPPFDQRLPAPSQLSEDRWLWGVRRALSKVPTVPVPHTPERDTPSAQATACLCRCGCRCF